MWIHLNTRRVSPRRRKQRLPRTTSGQGGLTVYHADYTRERCESFYEDARYGSFAASSTMRNARTRITHGSSWLLRSIVRPLEPPPPRPHFIPGFFFAALHHTPRISIRGAYQLLPRDMTSRITFTSGRHRSEKNYYIGENGYAFICLR